MEGSAAETGPRAAVARAVAAPDFLDFASGRAARPGEKRTIAGAARLQALRLGPGDRARAVRLSAETVLAHPRFAGFDTADRLRVQRVVDAGEWAAYGTAHRLLWLDDAGKPWLAVLKRTKVGEVYLQSYRRANGREVAKWREE